MDLYEASWYVGEMQEQTEIVYLRTEPEVLDFTSHASGKLILVGGKKRIELDLDRDNVSSVMGFLTASIFDKEQIKTILAWNIKSLFSYFRFYVPNAILPTTSIVDLQVIERFLGIEKTAPENLVEAVNRSKVISGYKCWKPVYRSLHLPLMLRVLPDLETTPLLHETERTSVFAYYDVEGQKNGRLRCLKKFSRSYVPHTMGEEQKAALKPRGYDLWFMCADIRHCEVNILQYLSKDERLKEIIDSGKDLHQEIYRIVTEDECDTPNKREKSKRLFLPVMYGLGPTSLGESFGISRDHAAELIRRIQVRFPTAWAWMASKQKQAKETGLVEDYFGRPRKYSEDEAYLARNFVVQAVAATVCLEKLYDIYKSLEGTNVKIAFSVHDGYGMLMEKSEALKTYKTVKPILEAESALCPGLFLKAEFKFGMRLNAMKVIGK